MAQIQQLFQTLFREVDVLLSQAKIAGRVEQYRLEVAMSTWKTSHLYTQSHDVTLHSTLLNLVQLIQEIIREFQASLSVPHRQEVIQVKNNDFCTSQTEFVSSSECNRMKNIYMNETQAKVSSVVYEQEQLVAVSLQEQLAPTSSSFMVREDKSPLVSTSEQPLKTGGEDLLDTQGTSSQEYTNIPVSELQCREEAKNQTLSQLTPLQPTTKETEAANVLMNLSFKAADRVNLSPTDRINLSTSEQIDMRSSIHALPVPSVTDKSLPASNVVPHPRAAISYNSPDIIIPDISKPTCYLLHSGGHSGSKSDSAIKREYSTCDEVPQINEKDLLPLATEVLCQFCSEECEDLVELHEHVLAAHNVPESEPPLMPSYMKVRSASEDEESCKKSSNGKKAKEDGNIEEVLAPIQTAEDVSVLNNQLIKHESDLSEKELDVHKQRKKKTEEGRISKRKLKSKKVSEVLISKNLHLEPDLLSDEILPACQRDICSREPCPDSVGIAKQRKLLEENSSKYKEVNNLTSVVAQVSDPLAIAVESSKIRVIEAKVTLFVCLQCSTCFTDEEEYKNHMCSALRPFTQKNSDGTIVLVDDADNYENRLQLPVENVWYFPEFLICRSLAENGKPMMGDLQIIHSTSGRKLQLHTNYQPTYLSEQLISFKCPTCENDSDSLNRFLEHLTKGPCMFRCPECSLVYTTQDKLQKHRASLHPTVQDRTCPNCHMVFEKRHQRNKHLKTKCSGKIKCNVCGGFLKNEYSLQVHMQSHEGKSYTCNDCGATFHRRAVLTRHMMRHQGKKPHVCSLCSARFYTRQHLRTHEDRHNGFRRFPCSLCSKAYFSKYDQNMHFIRVHSKISIGQKPACGREQKSTDNEQFSEGID